MEWKLEVVIVPVRDIEKSKQFYSEQVGFSVDLDIQPDEKQRFVQLTPHGSGCSITLTTASPDTHFGAHKLQLVVSDVDAAREALLSRGVDVSTIKHYEGADLVDGRGGRWNSFVFFTDPDDNQWIIQERPANE